MSTPQPPASPAGSSHRPATDVVAGRYALCDPLDSGASGTVWRAYDLQRGQYCAAKLLRRRDAGQLLRFVREQEVRLGGRHIASPYAWAAEESDVLIASELVDGGSLHRLVATYGALSEATVAAILDQLLDGLHEVHRAGLVHRDVKPGNLLVRATREGPLQVLLIDFGLAIKSEDARLTELGMVIGTPGYLSPELAHAETGPAPAQDLFAAGRVAAALLTAHEPKLSVPHDVSILDPVLRAVVATLVHPDPERRPADARTARRMLAGARMDPHPLSAGGWRIDLVPQIPPLPAGWHSVSGPTVSGSPVGPERAGAGGSLRAQPPTALEATPSMGVDPMPGSHRATVGLGSEHGRGPERQAAAPLPAPGRSRWMLLLGGVGAAAALSAMVLAIVISQHPSAPNGAGQDVTVSGSGGGSAVPGTVGVGPRPGETCAWSDEARTASGPVGAVSCQLVEGIYRWSVAGAAAAPPPGR